MKKTRVLAAYGAGGFGREALELGEYINSKEGERWTDFIFIDDGDLPDQVDGYRVLSFEKALNEYGSSLEAVVTVGEPRTRKILFEKLLAAGVKTPSLINPDSFVSKTAAIGPGTIVRYGSSIFAGAVIGSNVCVNPHANIGHDSVIGDGTMLSVFSNIAGGVRIGQYSYIAMNACVRERVKIGDEAVISMGAVVTRDVPERTLASGNPMKTVKLYEGFRVFRFAKN